MEEQWEQFLGENDDFSAVTLEQSSKHIMFEIDNIQFVVKGPSAEHQLPWRFEIV